MFTKTRSYQFAHVLIFTFPVFLCLSQSFGDLVHKPLLVDLTVEEGQRLKVIYGSCSGFHAVDVDSGAVYDIYLPTHVRPIHLSQLSTIFLYIYLFVFSLFICSHFQRESTLKTFFLLFYRKLFCRISFKRKYVIHWTTNEYCSNLTQTWGAEEHFSEKSPYRWNSNNSNGQIFQRSLAEKDVNNPLSTKYDTYMYNLITVNDGVSFHFLV